MVLDVTFSNLGNFESDLVELKGCTYNKEFITLFLPVIGVINEL
jgi:hypothetical protein